MRLLANLLPLRQIGGVGSAIANDLSAGPRTATIHGRIGTAGEGILPGQTQVRCIIPTSHILLDI